MSAEENSAIMRRLVDEVWNQGNLDLADQLLAPGFMMYDTVFTSLVKGADGFKDIVGTCRVAFPDLHITIEEERAGQEEVEVCFTVSGEHSGTFGRFPPTGVHVSLAGRCVYHFVQGKINRIWET